MAGVCRAQIMHGQLPEPARSLTQNQNAKQGKGKASAVLSWSLPLPPPRLNEHALGLQRSGRTGAPFNCLMGGSEEILSYCPKCDPRHGRATRQRPVGARLGSTARASERKQGSPPSCSWQGPVAFAASMTSFPQPTSACCEEGGMASTWPSG